MSMFSEIATEGAIQTIVQQIERTLAEYEGNKDVCDALKKIGRYCLTQFDWDTPEWAKRYEILFKD
jgi:hypothetical protein